MSIVNLATKKTTEKIRHTLSESEISDRKNKVSKVLQENFDLEEKIKEIKAEYAERIKIRRKEIVKSLGEIRLGFIDTEMEVYNVPDEDKNIIEFYDVNNKKVGFRPMTVDERLPQSFTESEKSF